MKRFFKKILGKKQPVKVSNQGLIDVFITNGKIPWSKGYWPYKMQVISELIQDETQLEYFRKKNLPERFASGLDERVIEYGWFFSKLTDDHKNLLDAGSTLNFPEFVNSNKISKIKLYIQTLAPEKVFFNNRKISYIYDDLRFIPIRDNFFDAVMSISTIEHIDMDNELFGVESGNNKNVSEKKYGYLNACLEMLRVCKSQGDVFITFPYGKWKSYGFFQQLDNEMVDRILDALGQDAKLVEESYFVYESQGWHYSDRESLKDSTSYNPHTGEDKGNDGAAHCRGICCLHFKKN